MGQRPTLRHFDQVRALGGVAVVKFGLFPRLYFILLVHSRNERLRPVITHQVDSAAAEPRTRQPCAVTAGLLEARSLRVHPARVC